MIRWVGGLLALATASAAPAAYDPAPWLSDLAQIRAALKSDYANLEWLEERGPVDPAFVRAALRITAAEDDAAARRAIERMLERFHDGHVEIDWPAAPAPANAVPAKALPPNAASLCTTLGYGGMRPSTGSVARLPGYAPLPAGPIPAGLLKRDGATVGAITLGVFQPEGYPVVCEAAAVALKLPLGKPCDDACSNALVTRVYAELTAAIATRIDQLRAAGADVLLVDVSGNDGGTEWVEAVARMLTAKPLTPARWGIVRTPAWAARWQENGLLLGQFAKDARGEERRLLLSAEEEARTLAAESARECGPGKGCPRLASGGYATGLLAAAPSARIANENASVILSSPTQFGAPVGAWRGPLIVLVDGETWSAAEELAATLQDNAAAAILGGRTGGAGCGHASGAKPIVLKNSGGLLTLPDCARFRKDGSNEVAGVIPDVLTGHRPDDTDSLKGQLISTKLDAAVALARKLQP